MNSELQKIRSGDKAPFRRLIDQYCNTMFCVAYSVLLSPAQAHLVVEKTFVRAYDSCGSFEATDKICDYLCRLTYAEAHAYAKQRRDASAKVGDSSLSDDESDRIMNINSTRVLDIDRDVLSAISILPDDQREVVLLHDGYGFDFDRMTAILGTSAGTIQSRLALGRNGMKNILLKKWSD